MRRRSLLPFLVAAVAAPVLTACGHGLKTVPAAFGPLTLPAHERVVDVPPRLEDAYVNCLVQVATEAGYQLIGFDETAKRYEMDKGFSVFLERQQNPTDIVERFHFWVTTPVAAPVATASAKPVATPLQVHLRLASYDAKTQRQVETRGPAADDFRRISDGCVISIPGQKAP